MPVITVQSAKKNLKIYLLGPVRVSYRDFRETGPSTENQQQTQPTYDAETGNRTRATLVGGECSHHCAIPAPCDLESDSRQRIGFSLYMACSVY